MNNKRFARRANAFSKRRQNHDWHLAIHIVYYTFIRKHQTLTRSNGGVHTTPAMTAGLADRVYDMEMIVGLVEAAEPKPGPRGPYKTQVRAAA